jgi:8-oxo-dGTP pyrophosphatase MutT (NUDIX family)
MAHIHTEPGQHDHTVSAYIVRLGSEPKILLHKHKILGCYIQFGGHIELDENPWQAVKHEILEESGYEIDQLRILQPKTRIKKVSGYGRNLHPLPVTYMTHVFDKTHNHIDISYVFVTDELPRHKPAEGESQKINAFSKKQVQNLGDDEIFQNIQEVCTFILEECLDSWEQVDPKDFDS